MDKIILFFKTTIITPPPPPWGILHLCCLALVAAASVAICLCGAKLRACPRITHGITIGIGVFLIVMECLKQVFYGLNVSVSGEVYWDYPWGIFPFQFCSTPLYVCVALAFTKRNGAVREVFNAFLATYGAFGGVVVLLHPNAVLNELMFATLHSMVWHELLIILGMIQWAGGTFRFKITVWLKSSAIFALFVAIALTLNFALPKLGKEYGFNMFFISPYVPCTILFLTKIWEVAPYPVFLAIYVLGFAAISAAIFYLMGFIFSAVRQREAKHYISETFCVGAKPYKRRTFKIKRRKRAILYCNRRRYNRQ